MKIVKEFNSTKNVTATKTMLGSVEGYLVDRNGNYTFSFKGGDDLITVLSRYDFNDWCYRKRLIFKIF